MSAEPSRNDPCPCGSGLKYKQCCEGKTKWTDNSLIMGAGVAILVVLGIILASMAFSNMDQQGRAPDCPPGQVYSAAHGHCH